VSAVWLLKARTPSIISLQVHAVPLDFPSPSRTQLLLYHCSQPSSVNTPHLFSRFISACVPPSTQRTPVAEV
jgi:hypothetical protein